MVPSPPASEYNFILGKGRSRAMVERIGKEAAPGRSKSALEAVITIAIIDVVLYRVAGRRTGDTPRWRRSGDTACEGVFPGIEQTWWRTNHAGVTADKYQ